MQYLDRVTVPTLNVAGWWDQEDFYGPVTIYEALEKHDTQAPELSRRRAVESRRLARAGGPEARQHRLRQRHRAVLPQEHRRRRGSPTGSRTRARSSWPKRRRSRPAPTRGARYDAGRRRQACRRAEAVLPGRTASSSFEPPTGDRRTPFDAYVSDPAQAGAVSRAPDSRRHSAAARRGRTWLVDDQRFVQDRPDVAAWETPPLTEDVVIAGDIAAQLFAATTGTDADWVVKLIDVYPETTTRRTRRLPVHGRQRRAARALPQELRETAKPIAPNQTDEFTSTCTRRTTGS